MAALKRLTFVILFLPCAIYAFGKWIVTGEEWINSMNKLAAWAEGDIV